MRLAAEFFRRSCWIDFAAMANLPAGDDITGRDSRRFGGLPDSDWKPEFMNSGQSGVVTRRALIGAFSTVVFAAAPLHANAFGALRGSRDIRRLRMYSARTGESLDSIYWIDGRYVNEALTEISYFMRAWRNGKRIKIEPRVLDIMAATHSLLDTDEPYLLISGYRSPETNEMLRRRSSGVARNSRHLRGEAADLRLKSRSVAQMFRAASAVSAGGVGRYSRSGFVHMDCGPVRSWGR